MKKTSIKAKILRFTLLLVMIPLVILGGASVFLIYQNTYSTMKQSIQELARVSAERVEQELIANTNIAKEVGCVARLSSNTISLAEKLEILDQKVKDYNFVSGELISSNGLTYRNNVDCSNQQYFEKSMKGEVFITEPIENKLTGARNVVISAPIWKDGVVNSTVDGVVILVASDTLLNDIISSIQISKHGEA